MEEMREQTLTQTDRWFNCSLIEDVNEQCLTTNEGWEAVLTGKWDSKVHTYIVHINTPNNLTSVVII